MRDLFQSDDGGWLQDPACSTGWSPRNSNATPRRCAPRAGNGSRSRPISLTATPPACAVSPATPPMTNEERRRATLCAPKLKQLEEESRRADELPEDVDPRLGEIETALAAFESARSITIRRTSPWLAPSSASTRRAA